MPATVQVRVVPSGRVSVRWLVASGLLAAHVGRCPVAAPQIRQVVSDQRPWAVEAGVLTELLLSRLDSENATRQRVAASDGCRLVGPAGGATGTGGRPR